ncbi:sensor domain-containing diguanylate cyclase [Sporosarcina limicola]|uniref:Diguanylate cyclase (GGDEF)-like protein n=1 Tax=Sporosarcina limicola TaxID=34101 RepID=A0A927R480_9BACL|nr:GGDEF domain-containing protein [Sporosarcina limicola]MBE1554568.1 diguanylate cyclase (GGDEF)-like protein [Sporosarcina limicola]
MLDLKKQRFIVFFSWILVAPFGFYSAYTYFPSLEIEWANSAFLCVVLFITMFLPLRFRNVTMSLERWITFTVFFQYGLFAELVFTQIAMFILLFSRKTETPISHRFLVNSLLFTLVSLASGAIFHSAGGIIGTLNFMHICLFGLLYAVSYTVINSILLQAYLHFEFGTYSLREKFVAWDFISTIFLLPFSISLYFLYNHFGNKSLLLIGIPFLLVLLITRMYNQSNNLNDKLSSATVIGRELADRLGFDDVLKTFIVKLKDVVPFDQAYVLDYLEYEQLIILMGYEDDVVSKVVKNFSIASKKFEDDGLDANITKIFATKKEANVLKYFAFPQSVESVMTSPIKRNQKTEGFLVLASNRRNVFQALEMKIIDVLTGYLATSLVKARYYENTVKQSETCALTKVHNFRYLDEKLDEEMIRFHTGEIQSLSIIMIDIDHFKSINDMYGHQSGNDLLFALAKKLKIYVGSNITLARYGGEEFVILLPNYRKCETATFAEQIRKEVASSAFRIIPDLSEAREPVHVQMTVSIGVANVPEDAKDAKMLLRNADRALYIGGKQAGRNRVGVYRD